MRRADRTLDDAELALDKREDRDDELDRVTERGVEETTEGITDSEGQLFGGESEEGGEGDDGDETRAEDDGRRLSRDWFEGEGVSIRSHGREGADSQSIAQAI